MKATINLSKITCRCFVSGPFVKFCHTFPPSKFCAIYGISRTVKLDRSVSGVGITGVPGAGAPLKIFTVYLHVTQLFAHVIGFFECAIGTGVCRGISNQA